MALLLYLGSNLILRSDKLEDNRPEDCASYRNAEASLSEPTNETKWHEYRSHLREFNAHN
jgi:hypothetical protein